MNNIDRLKSIETYMANAVLANDNAKSLKKERILVMVSMSEDASRPYKEVSNSFSGEKLECLISLQRANATLIELGYDYEKRKSEIEHLYNRLWFKKLSEEHIRLES